MQQSLLPNPLDLSWCDWQLDWPTAIPSSSHREEPEATHEWEATTEKDKGLRKLCSTNHTEQVMRMLFI